MKYDSRSVSWSKSHVETYVDADPLLQTLAHAHLHITGEKKKKIL